MKEPTLPGCKGSIIKDTNRSLTCWEKKKE
nr:MAG TPA: hypothetical protein [Bacteriophage sp.]